MGLRIIDRHRPAPTSPASEAEIMASLTAEIRQWPVARGFGSDAAQRRFLDHIREVRQRLATPAEVLASAERLRASIAGGLLSPSAMHGQVDVATLLELL